MTRLTSALTLFAALALTACGGGDPADTTKPVVSLSGPASVTAAGSVTYSAVASDASGVASVKFYRGSTLLGTDTTAPFEQVVTFSTAENGTQVITATATNTAGNSASATQSVTVNIGSGGSLLTRLSACTPVSMSSDPAASACLAGVYSGKTIDNKDCALTIKVGGGYDYASPTLNYTYPPTANTIRIFDYMRVQGFHQLGWSIGDPIQTTSYKLDFTARWGTGINNPTLEIKAEKKDAGTVSSTCIVPMT